MAAKDVVERAYESIGVANPDAEGLAYWTSQLESGAISPQKFESVFLNAAAGVQNEALAEAVATAQGLAPTATQNYQTQALTEQYRNLFGRNPEQEGYQYWMTRLNQDLADEALRQEIILAAQGIDPALYANLGNQPFTDINVAALEADPYAGRYATYSMYDVLPDAVNVSTVGGRPAQFVTPVGRMPGISSLVDGVWTYSPGQYALNTDQMIGQMNTALQSGALTQEGYNQMLTDLSAAQNVDDIMAAFNRAQAEVNLSPTGFQTGVFGQPVDFTQLVPAAYQGLDTRATLADVVTNENLAKIVNNALQTAQGRFGQPLDLVTPLSPGFYSERGFEPEFVPLGEGPVFRSGVAGYTENLPTGFTFGVPPVNTPIPVFTPGEFDMNQFSKAAIDQRMAQMDTGTIVGYTGNGDPIYAPSMINMQNTGGGG